jgi:hypothetical protein
MHTGNDLRQAGGVGCEAVNISRNVERRWRGSEAIGNSAACCRRATRWCDARVFRPSLKVLFITGFAENASIASFHLDSSVEVMTKPFVMAALVGKVRDLLR